MKITRTVDWLRRDFSFFAKCENPSCDSTEVKFMTGYDDDYYYNEVLPNIHCQCCGKSTMELGTFEKLIPIHHPHVTL